MIALATLLLCVPQEGSAAAEEQAFPLETTTVKTDGLRFYVEGRQRIPRNAKVVSLRHATLTGRGTDAVLEVDGQLEMRAVTGGKVVIENLRIELTENVKKLSFMNTEFRGKGGLFSHQDAQHGGLVYVASTRFEGESKLELAMMDGEVAIDGCHFAKPLTVIGVPRSDTTGSQLVLKLLGCQGQRPPTGVFGGLTVQGVKEAIVRFNDIAGPEARFVDCRELDLQVNNLRSGRLELVQSLPGKFGRTTIKNDDVRARKLVFRAPAGKGHPEKLTLRDCWFEGLGDPEAILAERVEDSRTDPEIGVTVELEDVREESLGLGGG